jgi:hypothetical protein
MRRFACVGKRRCCARVWRPYAKIMAELGPATSRRGARLSELKGYLTMNTTAGILAGLIVAGAGVALYRLARRTADDLRAAIDRIRGAAPKSDAILDFEKDPVTGIYRGKS